MRKKFFLCCWMITLLIVPPDQLKVQKIISSSSSLILFSCLFGRWVVLMRKMFLYLSLSEECTYVFMKNVQKDVTFIIQHYWHCCCLAFSPLVNSKKMMIMTQWWWQLKKIASLFYLLAEKKGRHKYVHVHHFPFYLVLFSFKEVSLLTVLNSRNFTKPKPSQTKPLTWM